MNSNMPLLQFRRVTKRFQTPKSKENRKGIITALDGVSLDLYKGEILALVGESGCGKTTLGKIAVDLVRPDGGDVLFEGESIYGFRKSRYLKYRRSVQMIHQDPYAALNPMRTILQTLSAPIEQYKLASGRSGVLHKAEELLRVVGLEPPGDILGKYPHQLSGGQRQRVVIARSISLNPSAIVADEAVSMIDVSLRVGILNLMMKLREELGIAYLFITHDLGIARYFAQGNRIAIMYLGSIMEAGPTEEVINSPIHPYTRALLTAVPVPDPRRARVERPLPLKEAEISGHFMPSNRCRFEPRCIYATDACKEGAPVLREIMPGRHVACIRADEIG
ncbi:MAG: ABC transporter ATP-binding protein [Firmicutes bacterium]|nr:ABC transporter ATP-binding protein [Bacillota bacterium]